MGAIVGYATDAWIDRALLVAGVALDRQGSSEGDEPLVSLEEARAATVALTRATAATTGDRMLVPEQVADGLGHLLAIYLIARAAAG